METTTWSDAKHLPTPLENYVWVSGRGYELRKEETMNIEQAIAELEQVGLLRENLYLVEAEEECEDAEILFWMNNSHGEDFQCGAQIEPRTREVISWNVFIRDEEGDVVDGVFCDSLSQLCSKLNEL